MSIVLTPEGTPASPVEGELYYDSTAKGAKLRIENEFKEVGTAFLQGEPHIIPGVLYPSYVASGTSNKLLDGTTSHSGAFGTAQSDGRKYYYTNIAGSKPIKDPRIGAHFGSQRHRFTSMQLLEQETATEGENVYSLDGRSWIRIRKSAETKYDTSDGSGIQLGAYADANFIEVTGYFNSINLIGLTYPSSNYAIKQGVNGASLAGVASANDFNTTVASPLRSRCVNSGSVTNLGITASLGINTVKIVAGGVLHGIELIAHDTSNVNEIKIPKQNVVSYGKKFEVGSDDLDNAVHPHYNPFAFKTDGTTAWTSGNHNGTAWPVGTGASANIDTATSLGLSAWISTNHYYPYNGGRVVWWVDSTGTLKCSVNMMPPNARSLANSASLTNGTEKGDDSAGTSSAAVANTTFYPTFTDQAIEHSLSEVAKRWHVKEFGNGNANGGTSGTYKDATMLTSSAVDIAYVMDDGLTSLSIDNAYDNGDSGVGIFGANNFKYYTFIGTGFAIKQSRTSSTPNENHTITVDGVEVKTNHVFSGTDFVQIAQNLPYGTHVVKILKTNHSVMAHFTDVSFYQPKRPPIPEDAVVLCDYMLMADFVPIDAQNSNIICKGVRSQNCSRDVFYDKDDGDAFSFFKNTQPAGFGIEVSGGGADDSDAFQARIPSFGTNIVHRGYASVPRSQIYIDSTSQTTTDDSGSDNYGSYQYIATSKSLGVYNWGTNAITGANGNITSYEIVTPIHTSSHYQSFETQYLHELIGGDRNMEQTNLVCSPDGKTWDQLTRDTSYIGNMRVQAEQDNGDTDPSSTLILDEWRGISTGQTTNQKELFNKDFAIGYDRLICLVDGQYEITFGTFTSTGLGASGWASIRKNGGKLIEFYAYDVNYNQIGAEAITTLVRGDYIQVVGPMFGSENGFFHIKRV